MSVKYKTLVENLMELIREQVKKNINKLPTEQELCRRYNVSRQTVRCALSLLEKDGIIEKRKGSGSYITGRSKDPSFNTAAILISSDDAYIYPALLEDMRHALNEQHFNAKIYVTDNCFYTERSILLDLLKTSPLPKGVIVEGIKNTLPNPNLDLYRRLQKKGVVILFLNNEYPELSDCISVKDADLDGSLFLTEQLIKSNHTSIAGIFKIDDKQGINRFHGFMDCMRLHDLPIFDNRIGWFDTTSLYRARNNHDTSFLRDMVKHTLSGCSAVICHNNEIAYWLIKELETAGITSPDDIVIAAFDHTYLTALENSLSFTLSHSPHEKGAQAVTMLINKIKGLPQTSVEIPWELHKNSI